MRIGTTFPSIHDSHVGLQEVLLLTWRAGQEGRVVLDGDDCIVVAVPVSIPCTFSLASAYKP